jgi:hypothetical protein
VHPAIALMIVVVIIITIVPLAVWVAENPIVVTSNAQLLLILAVILVVGYGMVRLLGKSDKKPP